MRRIITGQVLLIICCILYMVWWYRCYRPGEAVNRIGGANGMLLLITRFAFNRIVTTELILIVGWTILDDVR